MALTDMDASERSRKRLNKVETWDSYAISLLRSDDLIHWRAVKKYRRAVKL